MSPVNPKPPSDSDSSLGRAVKLLDVFYRRNPIKVGLLSAFAGIAVYGATHWLASFAWIKEQGGVAGWFQAFGSIAAIWAGFQLSRNQANLARQRDTELKADQLTERRNAAVNLAELAVQRMETVYENLEKHPNIRIQVLNYSIKALEIEYEILNRFDLSRLESRALMRKFVNFPAYLGVCLESLIELKNCINTRSQILKSAALENAKSVFKSRRNLSHDRINEMRQLIQQYGHSHSNSDAIP